MGANGDLLRASVSGQGDINGDNYSDIIIGVPNASPGGRSQAGAVYVIYGNTTLSDIDLSVTDTTSPNYFSDSKGFRVLGGANGDNLGRSVSIVGDINGDGYSDIIIGALNADPGGRSLAGEAYIIYGNTTLSDIDLSVTDTTYSSYFSNSKGFRVSGEADEDRLGNSVASAGDVNRDGYDDVIVGALNAAPGGRFLAGEAYVIYGNATLGDIDLAETDITAITYFSNDKGFRVSGEAVGDTLGISTDGAGDVNRDGYDDVIIGAWTADPGGRINAGEVYVIYGNTTLSNIDLSVTDTTSPSYFSNTKGFKILGGVRGDTLGTSAGGAGDINIDGYNDVIVGTLNASPGGRSQAGEVYVIYGNTTLSDIDLSVTDTTSPSYFSNTKGFKILGGVDGDRLGVSVASAGDINNDGYDDIIVGASNADPGGRNRAGEAYVIYGYEGESFQLGDLTIVNENVTNEAVATGNILCRDIVNMTISSNLTSKADIDLNCISNSLSFNGATLMATGNINLSNISNVMFINNNTLTAVTINLPSGFKISGPMPTFSTSPTYAVEPGPYQITKDIEHPSIATGDVIGHNGDLTISADVTSTNGIIDLRTSSSLTCLGDPTISATTASVIIVPMGTTGCIYAENSIVYLGGNFTIEDAIVNVGLQYSDEISTSNLQTLTVNNDIRSYEGDIDLSNVVELIFNDNVTVEVSSANTITLPPMANISGNATYIGNVEYRSRGNTGGGSDNGGAGSGGGGNSEDSGSSAGTIAGAVIGGIIGAALLGFGFYRWHEASNTRSEEVSTVDTEMHEGNHLPGNQNIIYDEA